MRPQSNDQVLVEQVLVQRRAENAPTLSESEFFEIFVAEQLLKEFDLSYDEIESGVMGGGNDGGIDAIYTLANGELVADDSDLSSLKRDVVLEVVIIQAKTTPGFGESAIEKLAFSLGELLDLTRPLSELAKGYREDLIGAVDRFRKASKELAARFPQLRFQIAYATTGLSETVNPNVQRKSELLVASLEKAFSPASVRFSFIGAKELLALARRAPSRSFELPLAETPISTANVGFVCLVPLGDFFKFISDDSGKLRRDFFESNVRDYQGHTEVNEGIQSTLKQPADEDFWWLNNGVTIVAQKATHSGKILTIEDPQIVNGLQTSTEVHSFFSSSRTGSDARNILVRVLAPKSSASRDRIIKATNSQTRILPASLRATDPIQRSIEEYFLAKGLFYDRRKNYHKNLGRPMERVVSIPYLAQAVTAILLQQPDDSRARPSSLLKTDSDYGRIFSPSYPLDAYLASARLMKAVDSVLRSPASSVPVDERTNIHFHVAMYAAALLTNASPPRPSQLADLATAPSFHEQIGEAVEVVRHVYAVAGGSDRAAKGRQMVLLLGHFLSAHQIVLGGLRTKAEVEALAESESLQARHDLDDLSALRMAYLDGERFRFYRVTDGTEDSAQTVLHWYSPAGILRHARVESRSVHGINDNFYWFFLENGQEEWSTSASGGDAPEWSRDILVRDPATAWKMPP